MGSEQNDGTSVPFSEPKLCANNCGFWGNPATMNLCSKCYRDFCLTENRETAAKAAVKISLEPLSLNRGASIVAGGTSALISDVSVEDKADDRSSSGVTSDVAAPGGSGSEQPPTKAKNRCNGCHKKVGLTGFKCKCGETFCGDHRYPEKHNCTFDFKMSGRDAIAKANPLVKADKVERI